ncbi:MAG: hypothetical protein NZZ41_01640 [Candidatus Dojkabacteria bacterium]|nr:hypothetical protein [Candidatus Dojkabacteria bacterium]
MTKIKITPINYDDLKTYNLSFIGCPTLIIPFLDRNFYPKFLWGKTKLEILDQIKNKKPLIIFNKFNKLPSQEKIPKEFLKLNEVFFLRYWPDIKESDWNIIRNNILETETHNFTFNWDLSHYNDPYISQHYQKMERLKQLASEYDKKELEELKMLTKNKK